MNRGDLMNLLKKAKDNNKENRKIDLACCEHIYILRDANIAISLVF